MRKPRTKCQQGDQTLDYQSRGQKLKEVIVPMGQADEALRKSEAEKKAILNAIRDMVVFLDRDLSVQWANKATGLFVGKSPGKLRGSRCYRLWHGLNEPCKECPVLNVINTGQPDHKFLTTPGGKTWEINAEPVLDNHGNILGAINMVRDTTDRGYFTEETRIKEAALEASANCFIIADLDGIITYANPSFLSSWGCKDRKGVLGRHVTEFWESSQEASKRLQKLLSSGKWIGELRARRIDGSVFDVHIFATVIRDETGSPISVMSSFFDITDKKVSEKALRNSEEKYHTLVENANEAILVAQDGVFKFANAKAEQVFGYSRQELASRDLKSFIHKDERKLVEERHWKRLKGEKLPSFYPFRIIGKQGNIKWVEINVVLFSWEERPAALCFISDITERKNAEEGYISVMERSLQGLHILQDDREVFVNDVYAKILGYTEDELLSLSPEKVRGLVHPEDRQMVWGRYHARVKGGDMPQRYEFRVIRKDGSVRWVEAFASRVEYRGKPAAQVALIDITDRKNNEEKLRRYKRITSATRELIYLVDKNYTYITVNDAYLSWHKKTKEEVLGHTVPEFLGQDVFEEKIKNQMDRCLAGEEVHYKEWFNFAATGKRYLDIAFYPYYEEDGTISGLAITARDITEAHKLEAQLQHAQRMESIGTLAGGIAHDFNNLLMGIQGYVSLMLMDIDPEDPLHTKLKRVEDQVRSGANLSSQLLGFARGGMHNKQVVNINEIITRSSDIFSRAKKEIKIHRKYKKNLWPVKADQGQMEQVLMNLFVNAWQAMEQGGNLYLQTANVVLEKDYLDPLGMNPGNYVRISVTDNGEGMDEETLQKIFDPFFTTKEMGRGTGLGLSSVYGIIKNHGGTINVYSEKGKGATFNIYLPAVGSPFLKASKGPKEKGIQKGEGTILIVDDEELVAEVGCAMLKRLGYNVLVANSGKEGVEIFQKEKNSIDLVILDMIMPEMSGTEAFDKIKEIDPGARVLLASGYSLNGHSNIILQNGCNGFIQKPFNIAELSGKIKDILA